MHTLLKIALAVAASAGFVNVPTADLYEHPEVLLRMGFIKFFPNSGV